MLINGSAFLPLIVANALVDGSAAQPSLTFITDQDTGLYLASAGNMAFTSGGVRSLTFGADGLLTGASTQTISMPSTGGITATAVGSNQNVTLTPSGTGAITTALTNTFSFSNPVATIGRLSLAATAVVARFDVDSGNAIATFGTSSNHPIQLRTNDTNAINITTGQLCLFGTTTNSSNGRIQLATHTTSAGGIGFGVETSVFRRAAGAVAISHIGGNAPILYLDENSSLTAFFKTVAGVTYLGSNSANSLILQTNAVTALTLDSSQNASFAGLTTTLPAAGGIGWLGRSFLYSPSDGNITLFNNAVNDFGLLRFGGSAVTFPALKRSTVELQVKLADDSAITFLQAKLRASDGTAGANFGPAVPASITVVDGVVTAAS